VAFQLQLSRQEMAMVGNPITGNTVRLKFSDGPMAGRSFDHSFSRNGNVTFQEVGGDPDAKPGSADQYHVSPVCPDVFAVSYLTPSGNTLTVVLDYKTLKLVGFASSAKSLIVQQGTFEPLGSAAR
jgi:hypothetical protein